jgi:integrase
MSHVRKSGRGKSPWRAILVDDSLPSGKFSESFETRREAKARTVEHDHDRQAGTYVPRVDGQVLFRARYDEWVASARKRKATTKDREDSTARSLILPTFEAVPAGDITFTMVDVWVQELVDAGYAPSTIHKAHQVLARALGHSVKAGTLRANPALGVELPSVVLEIQTLLAPTDISTVLDKIDEARAWFLLSVFGGTRAEESFALRAGRIDRNRPEISIVETVVETSKGLVWGIPKTKDGKRRIDIPTFVWEELLAHTANMRPDDLVFTTVGGHPVRLHNFRARIWQKAAIEAGLARMESCARMNGEATCPLCRPGSDTGAKKGHYIGPNIHDLRHTAVSLWIAQGSNPLQVKERAGHSKIAFTFDRYGHLFPKDEDPAMAKLDAMGRSLLGTGSVTPLRSVG